MEDADLEAELENAQLLTQNYQICIAGIPPFDPNLQTADEHVEYYTDCAVQVDPNMAELFGTGE